ncbi:hypothetical protein ATCC90586_005649 [Pythium insidiosum]|nr:hypothetical protein ATCC90586_005649 [Pythium insidiosum]
MTRKRAPKWPRALRAVALSAAVALALSLWVARGAEVQLDARGEVAATRTSDPNDDGALPVPLPSAPVPTPTLVLPPIETIAEYMPEWPSVDVNVSAYLPEWVPRDVNVSAYLPELAAETDWHEIYHALGAAVLATYEFLRHWLTFLVLVSVPLMRLLAAVTEAVLPHFLTVTQLVAESVMAMDPVHQAALAAVSLCAIVCYRQGYVQRVRLRYRAFRRDLHVRYRAFVASLNEQSRVAALALPHILFLAFVYVIVFYSPPVVLDVWDNESLTVVLSVAVPFVRSVRTIHRRRMTHIRAAAAAAAPRATNAQSSAKTPQPRPSGTASSTEWRPFEACLKYWVLWSIVTCVGSVVSLFVPSFVAAYFAVPTYWVNIVLAWIHSPIARGDIVLYTLLSPLVNPYANRIKDVRDADPPADAQDNEASNFLLRGLVAFGVIKPTYMHLLKDLWSQGPALGGLMFIFTPGFVTARGALLVGFGFPAYVTMGALADKRTRNYEWWLLYFTVAVAADHLITALGGNLSWLPLFYHAKLLGMMWLQFPYFRGAQKIFDSTFENMFTAFLTMMNTSNLHAANATSVVGNAIPIPSRSAQQPIAAAAPTPVAPQPAVSAGLPSAAATAAAAAAAQLSLNQMRAAFKPTMPAPAQTTIAVAPAATPVAPAAPTGLPGSMPVAVAAAAAVNAAAAAAAAAAVNPVVPNTAGAGALNLTGRWYLDREDSDSTNDYLEAMGLPLIARQAADKLDLMVIINQNPGDFIITRRTRIFTETKHLKFGQEVNVKGNVIKVTGDPTHIRTITQLSGYRGLLTDVRTIDEKGRMAVELSLQLPEKAPVVIRRYFQKQSDSTSLENLPPFDISLETAGDVKRKR